MSEFQTLQVDGLFFSDEDGLQVTGPKGTHRLHDLLLPLEGQRVRIALHFVPSNPPDPTRWGYGSCHWQATGECLFGHHHRPQGMLSVHGEGVLCRSQSTWSLDQFDGTSLPLPFHFLEGHDAQVVGVTMVDLERMRDALGQFDLGQIEAMGVQAAGLRQAVEQFRDLAAKKPGDD